MSNRHNAKGRTLRARALGFTLLEVMLGVVIITFLIFSVQRFLRAQLTAIRVATDYQARNHEVSALLSYLRMQLEDLPPRTPGALLGTPRKYNNLQADELQWLAGPGSGVLTTAAGKEYRVTLAIQPVKKGGGELEIGLRRQDLTEDERNYSWLPLVRPAAALEVRFYDARIGSWIDRWADQGSRPSLVRVRVWRTTEEEPLETVLAVPSARTQNVIQ